MVIYKLFYFLGLKFVVCKPIYLRGHWEEVMNLAVVRQHPRVNNAASSRQETTSVPSQCVIKAVVSFFMEFAGARSRDVL